MRMESFRKALRAILPGLLFTVMVEAGESPLTPPEPLPDEPSATVQLAPDDYWGVSSIAGEQMLSWENGNTPYCTGPECLGSGKTAWSDYQKGSYGESGCDDGCTVCPCWTVRAGAIFLRRSGNSAIPIVTGTPSYNTDNLGFSYEAGPLVSVIRHGIFCSAWDLEVTYFGVNDLDATATSADIDSIATTPVINVGGVIPGSTNYSSRIDSTELNLRRPLNDWITVLGGFRWIELGEDLNTDIGGIGTHGVDVNNHLYGLQLGADARLWQCGSFSLDGFGKAGVYANSSDSLTTTTGIGGALPTVVATEDHGAFVGELALNGQYDLSARWSIRGGYQLLWLDGVALAAEQLDNADLVTGLSTVDVGQTALYHGFNLAAQYQW